jgi:hypothetical protein
MLSPGRHTAFSRQQSGGESLQQSDRQFGTESPRLKGGLQAGLNAGLPVTQPVTLLQRLTPRLFRTQYATQSLLLFPMLYLGFS